MWSYLQDIHQTSQRPYLEALHRLVILTRHTSDQSGTLLRGLTLTALRDTLIGLADSVKYGSVECMYVCMYTECLRSAPQMNWVKDRVQIYICTYTRRYIHISKNQFTYKVRTMTWLIIICKMTQIQSVYYDVTYNHLWRDLHTKCALWRDL
jgi:hypothetical protein